MKKIILWILSFFSLFFIVSCNDVVKSLKFVYDGDTVVFTDGTRGRIFGIDAPELKSHNIDTKGLRGQYAVISKKVFLKFINNKKITWKKLKKGVYGRDIIKLYADNKDVALHLVEKGLARVYYISNDKKNVFYSNEPEYLKLLLEKQYQAFQKQLGFWLRKEDYKKIFPN